MFANNTSSLKNMVRFCVVAATYWDFSGCLKISGGAVLGAVAEIQAA